ALDRLCINLRHVFLLKRRSFMRQILPRFVCPLRPPFVLTVLLVATMASLPADSHAADCGTMDVAIDPLSGDQLRHSDKVFLGVCKENRDFGVAGCTSKSPPSCITACDAEYTACTGEI